MKSTSDGLFQHSGLRSWLVKLRLPLFIVVLMLLAPFVRHDWLLAGFTVSMVGELIQLWCFASLDKNATLTVRGPYTMVRNPMYLGRFFILLGFLMLLGNGSGPQHCREHIAHDTQWCYRCVFASGDFAL